MALLDESQFELSSVVLPWTPTWYNRVHARSLTGSKISALFTSCSVPGLQPHWLDHFPYVSNPPLPLGHSLSSPWTSHQRLSSWWENRPLKRQLVHLTEFSMASSHKHLQRFVVVAWYIVHLVIFCCGCQIIDKSTCRPDCHAVNWELSSEVSGDTFTYHVLPIWRNLDNI